MACTLRSTLARLTAPAAAGIALVSSTAACSGSDTADAADASDTGPSLDGGHDVAPDGPGDIGDATADGAASSIVLPQFIHGAARVNTVSFGSIPIVVQITGEIPDTVEVALDGASPSSAIAEAGRFVA